MPYVPIRTSADVGQYLAVGTTRENHWLDLKSELGGDNRENARDVAQFANASGGALVIGARESDQTLTGFNGVPDPPMLIARIENIVKDNLIPVPVIEPHAMEVAPRITIVVVNVPPSIGLVALHEKHQRYEFVCRGYESKRWMTVQEVEARMQNKERAMKLRIEKISPTERVGLDVQSEGITWHDWKVDAVDDDAITLSRAQFCIVVPLAYVEAVHRSAEPGIQWMLGLSCTLRGQPGPPARIEVRRFNPRYGLAARNAPR